MITVNNKIAVTPFTTTDTKTEVRSGVVVIKQRSELTCLKVVYEAEVDGDFFVVPPGSFVYVNGELCKHQLAKQIYELEPGKPFILIDRSMVVGYEER